MSHVVSIHTQVRDPIAIESACHRLQLPAPSYRTVRLFNSEVSGIAVDLPDWKYPVVCRTETGELHYDNYGGRWGNPARLNSFLQTYAVEKVKLEARKQGQTAIEQSLADGSLRVQIAVAG